MKRALLLMACLGLVFGFVSAADEPNVLWVAENDSGKVWANLSLTRQRFDEPFIPIAIGIQNKQDEHVLVDRDSVWLSDVDGIIYQMPSVKTLRKGYDRLTADQRLISFGGIPWEVWRHSRRYAPLNFFPDMRAGRGGAATDRVTLRGGYGTAGLLYFEKPSGLEPGKPFFLVVAPEDWQDPIRVQIVLS